MPCRKSFCVLAMSAVVVSAGCSSTGSMKGWNRLTASSDKNAAADPLSVNKAEVSEEFKTAQKVLAEPEKAQLAFARWKEDMGQHSEAKQRYQEILASDPDNLSARLGIARIEFATGRAGEAQKILQAAAQRNPNSSEVWIELGRTQAQREAWPEAIASFQKATDINANDQVARYELGIAHARAGHMTEAMNHLEYAVGEAAAMYNIGYVLNEQKRPTEAGTWFERALSAHPDSRTKAQAERMLARAGGDPARRSMSQSGYPQSAAEQFVQAASVPQIRPASSQFLPSIVSQQGTVSPGQSFSPNVDSQPQPGFGRQPSVVKQASSTTRVNGIPTSTAEYSPEPMGSLAMPIITNQPSTSGMPVVSPASQSRASFGDGNPPQWTGPQVVPPTAQGAGATGQSAVIGPIEPEPWRPGR